MSGTRYRAKSIKVELDKNEWDKRVDELSKLGFSIDTIAEKAGLTKGQVSYRTRAFGNSLAAYRKGENKEARKLLCDVNKMLSEIRGLRRTIPK